MRWLCRVGVVLLIGLVGLGVVGAMLYSRALHALAATERVQAAAAQGNLTTTCAELKQAATAWDRTATLSAPLAPLLHRLGWVSRLGGDLRSAPELIAVAQHGSAAGVSACDVVREIAAQPGNEQRLLKLAQRMRERPEQLTSMREHVEQARAAWQAARPFAAQSKRLAPYGAQLRQLDAQLARAGTAIQTAEQVAPHLDWLLGIDAPRRFMVVLQNPFELRPTGGFIGLVCVLQVDQAQVAFNGCQPSEAYAAPSAEPMPFAYMQYLRLGGYYLRDANWSPDFPTTARTLQGFWKLNGQPAVDGVVAVDPHALAPLLAATGPIALADGSQLGPDEVIAALLTRYYDGAQYRDKGQLAQLLPALVEHLTQTDVAGIPQLAAALVAGLEERHILVAVDQPKLAAMLAAQRWNGAITPATTDTLRVVDADVGYGAVNAFVERLTHYDVVLDDGATPLTATLTLTYTNRYSPWAEAGTSYSVNGECTDPETLKSERRAGCYANYLRVYVPKGSHLISSDGLERTLGVDLQHHRTIFGGYLRIQPGEQRVVRFQYRLPRLQPGSLVIEKQPGTLTSPVRVTAQTPAHAAEVWVNKATDVVLTIDHRAEALLIDGASDPAAAVRFARNTAYNAGLVHWRAGLHEQAVGMWQAADVLGQVLDHARQLGTEDTAAALDLIAAVAPAVSDGRALFEQAQITEAGGDQTAANALYQHAAQRSPDNPLAQLMAARAVGASGQAKHHPSSIPIAPTSAAVRRWRAAAFELEQAGQIDDAIAYFAALLQITPADRSLAFHHAELLQSAQQPEGALAGYAAITRGDDVWAHLAQARIAQLNGDREQAIALYTAALPLATTYQESFDIGDGLRDLNDTDGALQAYEQAATIEYASIWPLIAAGNMLGGSDPTAAQRWYQRAQHVDPSSGYPDWALGTLLLERDQVNARLLLEAAVRKQPEVALFRETLTEAPPPPAR